MIDIKCGYITQEQQQKVVDKFNKQNETIFNLCSQIDELQNEYEKVVYENCKLKKENENLKSINDLQISLLHNNLKKGGK